MINTLNDQISHRKNAEGENSSISSSLSSVPVVNKQMTQSDIANGNAKVGYSELLDTMEISTPDDFNWQQVPTRRKLNK